MPRLPFRLLPRAQQIAAILRMRGLMEGLRGGADAPERNEYRHRSAPVGLYEPRKAGAEYRKAGERAGLEFEKDPLILTAEGRMKDDALKWMTKQHLGREFGLDTFLDGYRWQAGDYESRVENLAVLPKSGLVEIRGQIFQNTSGQSVGSFTRRISVKERWAEHNHFYVTENVQGRGMAARQLAAATRLYRKLGLEHVETQSAGSMSDRRTGVETWPAYGFDFKPEEAQFHFKNWLGNVRDRLIKAQPNTKSELSQILDRAEKLGANYRRPRAWELASFRTPEFPRLGREALRDSGGAFLKLDLDPKSLSYKVLQSSLTRLTRMYAS